MELIKLSATDSTNDYLKQLANKQLLQNYTVVATNQQRKGRGQMGSIWKSEPDKNLTFSVLLYDVLENIDSIFNLNIAVATAILDVLKNENIPELKIKWPNDIMSANKKVGGILIENNIKSATNIQSIIGIGINVNQRNFEGLPQAASLCLATGQFYDCDELLAKIVKKLKQNVARLSDGNASEIWKEYTDSLFKKGVPMPFENQQKQRFMGIIQGVNQTGQLEVLLEDDSVQVYGIKEIQLLY